MDIEVHFLREDIACLPFEQKNKFKFETFSKEKFILCLSI